MMTPVVTLKRDYIMKQKRPADITALSVFFAFVAFACAVAGVMVHYPGRLHSIWRVIPTDCDAVNRGCIWLLVVSVACLLAVLGLWRCSYWGYAAACLVLVVGLAAHFFRALVQNDWWRLLIVVTIGALVLV
jgi:hypothetical protein